MGEDVTQANRHATRTGLGEFIGRGPVREIGTASQDPRRRYFLVEQGTS
jgi:hypothetical protein